MAIKITSASVDVTYQCNLQCKHCFNRSGDLSPDYFEKVMTKEELRRILIDLAHLHLSSLCFCGGETLLEYEFIKEILPLLKEISPKTSFNMVSNGLLFSKKKAIELKNDGLNMIQFSLDGFSNYSYDYIRGTRNGVKRVKKAIEYAIEVGIQTGVAILPHKRNLSEIDDMIEYLIQAKVYDIRLQPFMPIGRGLDNFEEIKLTEDDYDYLKFLLLKWDKKLPMLNVSTRVQWGDPLDHFFLLQDTEALPYISVNAYGEVMLSPYLPFVLWNLKEKSLEEYLIDKIDKKALSLGLVKETLNKIISVEDLSLKGFDLPNIYREDNIRLDKMVMGEVR